ncbi:MAG: hypothetical protein JSS65_01275 [Armatimonadetes bacterium]|nr:hypothetical protein [Armatimonadota bacterium]
MVKGSDGQFYGPVDTMALSQWRAEGRVNDASETKDFATGAMSTVGQVLAPMAPPPVLSQPVQPVQPTGFGNQYADYRRPTTYQTPASNTSEG